tara:strand:- start:86 stop:226 length:141 start_codon:yes stop_codon:yes gene_type:complete
MTAETAAEIILAAEAEVLLVQEVTVLVLKMVAQEEMELQIQLQDRL